MTQEQIFQLKLSALQLAMKADLSPDDQLNAARSMYAWLVEEALAAEAARAAKMEAMQLVG
jgi:hypothetical protein